jgi:hypothetical protein
MPKKVCCCNQISWPTSCCKPPEASCVDSTISISVDFYVKFFCEPNGNVLIWTCSNGQQYPINFETEHWRMNLTYTLSEDDVAPPRPRVGPFPDPEPRVGSLNQYANQFDTIPKYAGGSGVLGGFFRQSLYSNTSGDRVTGGCLKCTNPCDAATKIQGCHPIYGLLGNGPPIIIAPGCAVGYPGDIFSSSPSTQTVVACDDCCNEDIYNTINFGDVYHACDQCNIGANGPGEYAIGVKKINNAGDNIGLNLLSTDISLRQNASWTFDFIPSTQNQVSKLNIQLLSCHFGCKQRGSPGVYINNDMLDAGSLYYKDSLTHLVDMYNIKDIGPSYNYYSISRFYDYMCSSTIYYCDLNEINSNLIDKVCFAQTQYFNPPWCVGLTCDALSVCGCRAGGDFGGGCGETPFEAAKTIQIPCSGDGSQPFTAAYDKNFATNCGCCCDAPGTCYRYYHRSADPDQILRPHELSFELGIGYNSTTPCGEAIQMDFYEELYTADFINPNINSSKINKHLVTSNGDRYVNPEWINGINYTANGSFDPISLQIYNFYSQGMRMKLTYTRNSIPYEKYNHNSVNSCVPETIANPILDYPANNKIYPDYPKQGHPNMVNHPQGIYEGEYALSKASYWAPSLNTTYDTVNNPSPFAVQGSTSGIPQQTAPVVTTAFNKCYPFNTLSNRFNIINYPLTWQEGNGVLNVDDPTKKQAYPFTYQYSYGDVTAIVRQI